MKNSNVLEEILDGEKRQSNEIEICRRKEKKILRKRNVLLTYDLVVGERIKHDDINISFFFHSDSSQSSQHFLFRYD